MQAQFSNEKVRFQKITNRKRVYSRVSQFTPMKSLPQIHLAPPLPSDKHVPPFKHVTPEQSMAIILINKITK